MFAKKSISCILTVLFIVVFMLAVTPLQVAHAAGECYVKRNAGGTNVGTSWTDAYTDLQSALGASPCTEIWVAAGTYKPTTGADRDATFQLKNGVALYGGFAGTETARNQRNPMTNLTILSGDIDNNDSQTPIITDLTTVIDNTLNSYHVVTGASGATLDGFTITAGYGGDGAGMYNASSSPALANLVFSGNRSGFYAGGMYNVNSSSPVLTNVTFRGNSSQYGGGMFNQSSSNPTLANVTFNGNQADYSGGGMFNQSSSPTLTNVTFNGNAAVWGAGLFAYGSSNPTLTNVTFYGNAAQSGGGIFSQLGSNPQIRNTIFWGNTASIHGAQIDYDGATSTVSDSVVQGGCPAGTTCMNILPADPLLGALGNYGGFTQTIPLLAGSSAINTGNAAFCPPTDQRGVTRPQPAGGMCDIGAFEQDDFTAPTVNAFTATTPSNSLSVPITAFTASDAFGVTGYLITTSATAPAADAAGWTGTAPTTYTVASDGPYTLYPWAKDAAGNVSAVFGSPRTVVVDTTKPTVNTFTVTTPSNSLNIPITAFTASDTVGVTGYLITTSNAAPAAGAIGWSGTAPTTFTVASDGSYTLYPWAKDSIGHISAVFASPRAVVVDTTPPTVNTFTVTTPSNSLNIPITAFTASDTVGVTGYLITTSATAPAAGAAGWTGIAPTTYTFASDGSYTLYPWAKDAVGNVSAVFASPRPVVVDTTKPTVNTFTITTPSKSLNIPITAFTASDAAGVTGYLITTSATPPAAGAVGWTGTAPTTYTVASDASYTLYPWAKDAAGNVSAVFASPRAVVVDTTKPTVTSIIRANPSPTNLASMNFTVTFSESVTGVAAGDFALTKTGTLSGESVTGVSGGPTIYTVTVNRDSGNGTLRLDVPTSATISDQAGNPLTGLPYTSGETYTVEENYWIYLPQIRR